MYSNNPYIVRKLDHERSRGSKFICIDSSRPEKIRLHVSESHCDRVIVTIKRYEEGETS